MIRDGLRSGSGATGNARTNARQKIKLENRKGQTHNKDEAIMAQAPFAWFGGKQYMVDKILPYIPAHTTYVETCGGAASVLLAKSPSAVEVYNDIDSGLVNFFRVLRDEVKAERLIELCTLTPYSREEFELARAAWMNSDDDVVRAHQWFIVARMSFSGIFGKSWGYNVGASTAGKARMTHSWLNSIEQLPAIVRRLRGVQIEHLDLLDCIDKYDTPETVFYVDPTYAPDERVSGEQYAHEMTNADHLRIVQRILTLQGKAIISGYDSVLYHPLVESGYKLIKFKAHAHSAGRTRASGLQGEGSTGEKQQRTECLWVTEEHQAGLF